VAIFVKEVGVGNVELLDLDGELAGGQLCFLHSNVIFSLVNVKIYKMDELDL
jgi:hypothetical protein